MGISNMAAEMGAKVGLIEADKKTKEYLENIGVHKDYDTFESDEDTEYYNTYGFDASDLEPMVACPH